MKKPILIILPIMLLYFVFSLVAIGFLWSYRSDKLGESFKSGVITGQQQALKDISQEIITQLNTNNQLRLNLNGKILTLSPLEAPKPTEVIPTP